MLKIGRMTLLIVGLSLSVAGLADDSNSSAADNVTLPEVTLSSQAVHETWTYAPRWRLSNPVETTAYPVDWAKPGVKVSFQDGGALARVSKLRNLSLLTFAEFGRARLFLGVNDSGVVGLHLRAFHRVGDERYLEVVRMPYLKEGGPDKEAD